MKPTHVINKTGQKIAIISVKQEVEAWHIKDAILTMLTQESTRITKRAVAEQVINQFKKFGSEAFSLQLEESYPELVDEATKYFNKLFSDFK